ncbi:ubiquitin C-terminal hydrolase [Coprinopsis cinerea okayama7|uniref:ubiquitinyl hydrolase 1 n=1 Tax=Coprinopsis cinerea (strain Okayama-7 / 130 / ATCC MYA-4618 / FGSC 9003) TaxID=240176 RepID=A8N3B7_COPC7|nr:ubiquitin C-terminal hydrolase [Coprinopsis cinerea okayama7\|eukprot:XP_001829362.2 ubiquitin C-terminal hydrolase [Coprinopsis cinerea okayama7\
MARSKWISFAAQHALNKDSQKSAQPDQPAPSPPPAEVKKFGLENALYFCTPFRDLMLQASDSSAPQDCPAIPIASTVNGLGNKHQSRPRQPERKQSTSVIPTESTVGSASQPSATPIPPSPPTLFSALRSLFIHIATQPGDKGTVAPKAFIDKLKELNDIFRSTMHQDAHEFLNYLLNRIVEEMEVERKQTRGSVQGEDLSGSIATLGSKAPPTLASSTSGTNARDATLVHRLFEGILTSETRCLTCETVSSRDESFLDLSIDIEQNSSVTACLRQFSASEMLCNRNKFFCDACCDLQEAEKRMKIKKLPNVLALHLKRFKYQEDLGRYIKLTYRVAFPMDLRLFNTVDDMEDADRLYHLFAIVVHIGNGPHHGHYISIIKNCGTWFVFDDDNVYSIPESDIPKYFGDSNSGSAYVLYYQADDIDLVSLGVQLPEPPEPPPTQEPATDISAGLKPPITLATHVVGHPPGLEPYPPISEELDAQDASTTLPAQSLIPEKPTTQLTPVNVTVIPDTADQSPPQPAVSSPSTTRFGNFLNTLRRAPSASLAKANISATTSTSTTDSRRSVSDRSPRLSASSPSLSVGEDNHSQTPPPPVPPLPPNILTTAPPTPHTNGEDKEKPKKEGKGWFGKRKSFKAVSKTPTTDSPTAVLPPSPNRRTTEERPPPPTPSNSNWFRPFGSSQRDSQTSDHGRSRDTLPEGSQSEHLTPRNGHASGGGLSPYDDIPSTPASTSSSLNSAPVNSPGFSSLRASAPPSTSSSSGSVPKKHNYHHGADRHSSSHDQHKPKNSRSSSPSNDNRQRPFPSSKKSGDFDRSLPPLPHTPPTTYLNPSSSTENGHLIPFYSEPEPITSNGYHHHYHQYNVHHNHHQEGGQHSATSQSAPPTSFPEALHQRSTTLPPTSIASSVGANTSSGSNSSSTSGIRKATRKLSLTAPMLGFGRSKDKK